jgi:hypothetical protein
MIGRMKSKPRKKRLVQAQREESGGHPLKPAIALCIRKLRGSLKGSGVLESLMDERKRERLY